MHALVLAAAIACPPGYERPEADTYPAQGGRQRFQWENRERGIRFSFEMDDGQDDGRFVPVPRRLPRYEIRGYAVPQPAPSPYGYGSGGGGVRCDQYGCYPAPGRQYAAPPRGYNGNGGYGRPPACGVRESYSR